MGRIRTVKPELFKHEELFDLEEETSLPIRVAFIGLFTVCDRNGRFKWRPRTLKLDVLPYDSVEFSRVLDALATRGFIQKYAIDGEEYGVIPSFARHQIINNREGESDIPSPTESSFIPTTSTRDPRVPHADTGEGKGKEGKGNGKEGEGSDGAAPPSPPQAALLPDDKPAPAPARVPVPAKPAKQRKQEDPTPTALIWRAYKAAYRERYGVDPVHNAKVMGQLSQLLARLGAEEAPQVATFYVGRDTPYYRQTMHSVDAMLRDAEKLRTEWLTAGSGIKPRSEFDPSRYGTGTRSI